MSKFEQQTIREDSAVDPKARVARATNNVSFVLIRSYESRARACSSFAAESPTRKRRQMQNRAMAVRSSITDADRVHYPRRMTGMCSLFKFLSPVTAGASLELVNGSTIEQKATDYYNRNDASLYLASRLFRRRRVRTLSRALP